MVLQERFSTGSSLLSRRRGRLVPSRRCCVLPSGSALLLSGRLVPSSCRSWRCRCNGDGDGNGLEMEMEMEIVTQPVMTPHAASPPSPSGHPAFSAAATTLSSPARLFHQNLHSPLHSARSTQHAAYSTSINCTRTQTQPQPNPSNVSTPPPAISPARPPPLQHIRPTHPPRVRHGPLTPKTSAKGAGGIRAPTESFDRCFLHSKNPHSCCELLGAHATPDQSIAAECKHGEFGLGAGTQSTGRGKRQRLRVTSGR